MQVDPGRRPAARSTCSASSCAATSTRTPRRGGHARSTSRPRRLRDAGRRGPPARRVRAGPAGVLARAARADGRAEPGRRRLRCAADARSAPTAGRRPVASICARRSPAPPTSAAGRPTRCSCRRCAVLQDVVEVRGAFVGTADSSRTTTAGKPTIVQRFELAQGERVRDVVVKAGGAAAYADLRLAFVDRSRYRRAPAADPDRPAAAAGREGRDPEHPAAERRRADAAGGRGQGLRRRRGEVAGRPRLPARPDAARVPRAGRGARQPRRRSETPS